MTLNRATKVIMLISIALFLIALSQPCFDTEKEAGGDGEGFALLLSGFFGFFSSTTGLTWLANPALWLSWIFVAKKPKLSLTASFISVLIGLLFMCCTDMIIDESGSNRSAIVGYRTGYWLWLASMFIMLIGNLYLKFAPLSNPIIERPGRFG
ncbi:MAG: hypothetical protein M3O71_05880 [Bacteroidota bacterium]|nr:hypothetical protein [Bacteroidota bacterium]